MSCLLSYIPSLYILYKWGYIICITCDPLWLTYFPQPNLFRLRSYCSAGQHFILVSESIPFCGYLHFVNICLLANILTSMESQNQENGSLIDQYSKVKSCYVAQTRLQSQPCCLYFLNAAMPIGRCVFGGWMQEKQGGKAHRPASWLVDSGEVIDTESKKWQERWADGDTQSFPRVSRKRLGIPFCSFYCLPDCSHGSC